MLMAFTELRLVSRSGAVAAMAVISTFQICVQKREALTMFRQANPDVATLIAHPNLGWQRSSRSDLHSRWFQSDPVLGEVYDAARYIRRVITKSR